MVRNPPHSGEIRVIAYLAGKQSLLPPEITYDWRQSEKEFTLAVRQALGELPSGSWAVYAETRSQGGGYCDGNELYTPED